MKAGNPNIKMMFPGDTEPVDVPRELAAKAAKEAGAKVYRQPLTTGQHVVKYFADPLPALGGFAGGLTGGVGDAAAGIPTGGTAWAAMIPAVMGGAAVGGGLGSAAQMALYKSAGIPFDESPLAMGKKVATDAAVESGSALLGHGIGGGIGKMLNRGAPAFAKAAIGEAPAGLENEVISRKAPISTESINSFKGNISRLFDEVTSRAQDLDKKVTFTWNDLAGKLRGSKASAEANDVVTRRGERALNHALEVLRSKFGPASRVESVRLGQDVSGHSAGRAIDPHFVVPEGEAIKPSRLAEIMRHARQRINDLIEQRKVPGASPRPAGPLEKAYSDIYDTALGLLKERDPAIGEAGSEMNKLYELQRAYNDALTAPISKSDVVYSALGGRPFPELASRTAIAMGSKNAIPVGSRIARGGLSGATAVGRGVTGIGAPADATDTQLIEQAIRRGLRQ